MSEPAKQGVFYCRNVTGLALTGLTLVLLTIADVSIAVIYENILMEDETACSLKAAYSLFIITTVVQFVIVVYDTSVLCILVKTGSPCKCCDCYYMKVAAHFSSCVLILIGTIIYGVKDPDKIGYSFWVTLIAGLVSLVNGLTWLIARKATKYIGKKEKKKGEADDDEEI